MIQISGKWGQNAQIICTGGEVKDQVTALDNTHGNDP